MTKPIKKVARHGLADTPLHKVWAGMINRCYHKGSSGYKNYGARGIKICDRWNIFLNFYQDNKDKYQQGLSIERINVDGDYCPENVTWIPTKQQAKNRRSSVHLTYNGQTKIQKEWSKELNISQETIRERRQRGLPIEMVLSKQKFSKHTKIPEQFTI